MTLRCVLTFITVSLLTSSFANLDSLENELKGTSDRNHRLFLISKMLELTISDDAEASKSYVKRFREEAEDWGNEAEIARSFNFEGMLAYYQGRKFDAIRAYTTAAGMYRDINDVFMSGMMSNNIGALYEETHPEKSIEFYESAISTFKALDTTIWVAGVKHNLAFQYRLLGEYEKSFQEYEQSRLLFQEVGEKRYLADNLIGMAVARWRQGEPEESMELLRTAEAESSQTSISSKAVLMSTFCQILVELNRLDEAEPYCALGEQYANSSGHIKMKRSSALSSYQLYKAKGDFKNALFYHEHFKNLSDSLKGDEQVWAITEMTTQYETAEKDRRLALAERKQQRDRLFIIVGGLLLIGGLIFSWMKIRSNNKLKEQQLLLKDSLEDRELLLREIHHRVKNNLQIVSSLLSIQSRSIKDEHAQQAVNDSRNRVKSISLIHQNLYQEDNIKGIKARNYVRLLCDNVLKSYDLDTKQVQLIQEIEDLKLDVDTTIPLGLILNELLTNVFKYAFPDGRSGKVNVRLNHIDEKLVLQVVDNGIGFDLKELRDDSFGMKMISAFSKKLDADFDIVSDDGTAVELRIGNYKLAS